MNEFREAIARLNNSLKSDLLNSQFVFDMPKISNIEEELLKMVDGNIKSMPPENVIEKLVAKMLNGAKKITRHEIRDLPFIIYDSRIDMKMTADIIKNLDLSKERYFKRLLYVYFSNYDSSPKTKFLAKIILLTIKKHNSKDYASDIIGKIVGSKSILFAENCMDNLAVGYLNIPNIDEVLESIGLLQWKGNSNFIEQSIEHFFKDTDKHIDEGFKILEQIASESEIHEAIMPSVADSYILAVDKDISSSNKQNIKKKAMDIFYNLLGDPRFGKKTHKWVAVSEESRNTFIRWLAEDDLELFFKIIDKTAVDSMWRYRKKFWKAYLPYISNTWLFLGRDARNYAQNVYKSQKNHGKLVGGLSNQSVFVFQIGRYIFAEWSHIGKLRVKKLTKESNLFGKDRIEKQQIYDAYWPDEWTHSNSDGYTWQSKVSYWIKNYCGIEKTINDWR